MGHMTKHEFLINTLTSTVLNVVPLLASPIAPSGVLREKFDYEIRLPEFEEATRKLLREKGAKIPDLLLINKKRKLLVVVECKSSFTFQMEENLSKQIKFYSSQDFERIWKQLFSDIDNSEIWVFAYKNLGNKIAGFISSQSILRNLTNVVVWEVALSKGREEAEIHKVYGNHMDNDLNNFMGKSKLKCSPPKIDLLIDPTLTYVERIYRIGRRILAFMAAAYLTEEERKVTLQDFRRRNADALMTDKELTRCFRYLITLIPQIGHYENKNQQILLAKRPSVNKVKSKLVAIQSMSEESFKLELARIGKKNVSIVLGKRPKEVQKTKLDRWIKKPMKSNASFFYYPREDVLSHSLFCESFQLNRQVANLCSFTPI